GGGAVAVQRQVERPVEQAVRAGGPRQGERQCAGGEVDGEAGHGGEECVRRVLQVRETARVAQRVLHVCAHVVQQVVDRVRHTSAFRADDTDATEQLEQRRDLRVIRGRLFQRRDRVRQQ